MPTDTDTTEKAADTVEITAVEKTADTKDATATAETKATETVEAKATEPPKAPAEYTLTVDDTLKAFLPDRVVERVKALAKANDWTNDDAQAYLTEHAATVQTEATAMRAEMLARVTADPTWGGAKLAETQTLVDRGIDAVFGADHPMRTEFLAVLDRSMGNVNLPVVAFLATLGKKVSEDAPGFARGGGRPGNGPVEERLYDHPTSKSYQERT